MYKRPPRGVLTDGGCTWLVVDVRDGTPVGTVRGSLYLPDGYIIADGSTVQRADYPRLVAFANEHNLWNTDSTETSETYTVQISKRINPTYIYGKLSYLSCTNDSDYEKICVGDTVVDNLGYLPAGTTVTAKTEIDGYKKIVLSNYYAAEYSKGDITSITVTHTEKKYKPYAFGIGDGSTTFELPNYIGLFSQFGDTVGYTDAGLPNITGGLVYRGLGQYSNNNNPAGGYENSYPEPEDSMVGALYKSKLYSSSIDGSSTVVHSGTHFGFAFNAQNCNPIYGNSDTVQPPAITLLPILRY